MRERNADGVVDLGRRGEGRVEILPVKLAHQFEADLARNLPAEFAAGEFAGGLAADMELRLGLATSGKVTNLKGGLPLKVNGFVVGGIGVGSGTGEQDLECAQAAVDLLATM